MSEVVLSEIHFVEDSDDEVFISKLLLRKDGVRARLVHHSGSAAFEGWLEAKDPESVMLVFVDLNMPGKKGTELLADCRIGRYEGLIIGICSGSEDPEDIRLAFNAGAEFFVNKPLGRAAIETVCGSVERLSLREGADGKYDLVLSKN